MSVSLDYIGAVFGTALTALSGLGLVLVVPEGRYERVRELARLWCGALRA